MLRGFGLKLGLIGRPGRSLCRPGSRRSKRKRRKCDAGYYWEHLQMTKGKRISRRSALKLGTASAILPLVHIRTAGAAGKVAIGFWDHWVPGGNDIMQKQVNTWADKNKVEVTADFITGNGNKLMMTGVAESQAKTGHDVYTFYNWDVYNSHDLLAPVDDVVKYLTGKYGAVDATAEYLAKQKDHWTAVPSSSGTQTKPPCVRIGWFKKNGLDVEAMYPGEAGTHRGAGRMDVGGAPQIRGVGEEGRHDVRAGHGRNHQHGRYRHARCTVSCVRG